MKDGFIKAASASPVIKVADTEYNAQRVIETIKAADEMGVKMLVFPELVLTGCTCYDLTGHNVVLRGAKKALLEVIAASEGVDMLVFVGLPISVGSRLYSCAAAIYDGELLGLVPRENVRGTQFAEPADSYVEVEIDAEHVAVLSTDYVFTCAALPDLKVAAELGADIDVLVPPSVRHAQAGATVIAQLASFPETVTSADEAELTLRSQSRRLHCGMIMAAPGKGESTTDKTYYGLCAVVDDGETIAVSESGSGMAVSETDVFNLCGARIREQTYDGMSCRGADHCFWELEQADTALMRRIKREPFVPDGDLGEFAERCLTIQAEGLIKRMQYTNCWRPVIGVSGGVDSTLVMLACAKAMDLCSLPRKNIVAVTMPCFGTTDRTKNNAITIAEQLGAELRVIPIGESVKKHFETIGHDLNDHSVVFENAQARERTMVLLDIANKVGGLDVGTKDLSEQADGWCTYNGDQISNYDINAGMTKTMVRAVVKYVSETTDDAVLAAALHDIWDTPVTPELLPIGEQGELLQKSEDSVGPYILQDFFLYHMVMRGGSPEKVLRLAEIAFEGMFDRETLLFWLKSYCRRFFSQQFKRSASADGPAVMGFTLSPRDGHKMPSDACNALWLEQRMPEK